MERITVAELLQKIKTLQDRVDFYKEQGKIKKIIIGKFYPKNLDLTINFLFRP